MTALGPYGREFIASPAVRHGFSAGDGFTAYNVDGTQSALAYSPGEDAPWHYNRGGVLDWYRDPPDVVAWPPDPLRGGARTRVRMFATV